MNNTIEMTEQDEPYWPEFVFGFPGTDEDDEGEDKNE